MTIATVYVVAWGDEHPAEVDSIHATQENAEARAKALNEEHKTDRWNAQEWHIT